MARRRPARNSATSTLKVNAATLILIFTLIFPLPPMPVLGSESRTIDDDRREKISSAGYDQMMNGNNYMSTSRVDDDQEEEEELMMRKKAGQLGSRPPGCLNKCMNCRPCQATLVIPPHDRSYNSQTSHREDDTYYLLLWKCRCGDKLFQP